MIIILVALICTVFIGVKFRKSDNLDSYLDRDYTTSIIGVFAVIIFFSHFFGYMDQTPMNKLDEIASFTTSALGQLMVVPFLFFSGYGVFEQFKKKGAGYASSLPKNRIFKVYLMFFISWLLYVALSFVLKTIFTPKEYIISAFGIVSIGNSNWYVVVILALYLSTYLSIKFGSTEKMALAINIVLCSLLILILKNRDLDPAWWNTIASYAFGLVYSYFKPRILAFYKKHKANRWIVLALSISLTSLFGILDFTVASEPYGLFYLLMELSFCMTFASLLSVTIIGNKIILTLGKYCFWIYILQRISMRIFYQVPAIRGNVYVYFLLCAVVTAILAFSVEKLFNLIWSLINRKKKRA